MTKQHGAATGAFDENDSICDRESDVPCPAARSTVSATDMLTHMADMLMELRRIADQNKWQTLSGLLALSHAEANVRRDEITLRHTAFTGDR